MVKTIDFTLSQKKKEELMAVNFIAKEEERDFNSLFMCLADNAHNSYLFKEIDMKKYYYMIMDEVKANHYNSDGKLNNQAVNGIVQKYSEYVNFEDFVPTLKKLNIENIEELFDNE